MTLVDYCTEKIVKGYALSSYSSKFDKKSVKLLLTVFPDRFLLYKDSVVVYLRLSDVNFESLKAGALDLTDPKALLPLFKDEGRHTHVICVVSDSVKDMLFLGNYLKDKSLSWFRPDMSKLVVYERS